jgi:uncharacterized protein (DUF1697 family)
MSIWIALLRGVNVLGANRLPMAELRDDLSRIGLANVATYIQSGNVVFDSSDHPDADSPEVLAGEIATAIEKRHGFRPWVLVLSAARFRGALEANPFPEAEAEPKTLHLYFLAEQPGDVEVSALEAAATPTERFHLGDRVFYLHTPDGFGPSKLASRAEAILGVPATARNWRTVGRVWEMVEEHTSGS